jgi:uncharacterized membrane protein YccC
MKKNMGAVDRIIRTIIAIAIGAAYYLKIISGLTGMVLLVVGGILLVTSILGFCPLYRMLGIPSSSSKVNLPIKDHL